MLGRQHARSLMWAPWQWPLWHKTVKVAQLCPTLCESDPTGPWNSPGQNISMGSLSLLQGIFPSQGSNPGLPHRTRDRATHAHVWLALL